MADRYRNFAELAANERVEIDYLIRFTNRGTPFVILAPHGGMIEPGTSAIAEAIAGCDLSFYAFEALRPTGDRGSLHITSANFDEPQALALAAEAQKLVSIHGRADDNDPLTVVIGGRDVSLGEKIAIALKVEGFVSDVVTDGPLAGRDPANICNRSRSGTGAQLELPRSLRRHLVSEAASLEAFCRAIRSVLFLPGAT